MAPPTGIPITASPFSGGVGPFTYDWSFSSYTTPGLVISGLTTIAPSFVLLTNLQTIYVTSPTNTELLICCVRCKITDSTGGVSNPATNLVTYSYFNLFITDIAPV